MQTAPRNITILIPAAGKGTRMGHDTPKQFLKIAGKTILRHTVERLHTYLPDAKIMVMTDPNYVQQAQNELTSIKNTLLTHGGKTRKESVYNGLKCITNVKHDDLILIHDAARPFITYNEINDIIQALDTNKAATLYSPSHNSICTVNDFCKIANYQDRDQLKNILTPQGFHYDLIMHAHNHHAEENESFTDDAALVHALGHDVTLVKGSQHNFKITTAEDLNVAKTLLQNSPQHVRTGNGFDVHAFDNIPATSIRLGGIDIPFDKALKGHSDADVALHTVTDALLGAIGAGDIGDHFPPADDKWKGKDSAHFLAHAAHLIREQRGEIGNIDLTIICEAPKLSQHKHAIKQRIANILDIPADMINVKATTTEQLGFTGRREGIAAQASATVYLPA